MLEKKTIDKRFYKEDEIKSIVASLFYWERSLRRISLYQQPKS
jgi:hypothetical protein